jgi:hypothetical protein
MIFLPLHQIVQPLILLVWVSSYVPQMLDPSPTLAPAELLKRPCGFKPNLAGKAGFPYLSLPHILSFSLSFGCKKETEVWSMQLLHFHSIALPLLDRTRLAPGMRRQVMQRGCIISVPPVAASSG